MLLQAVNFTGYRLIRRTLNYRLWKLTKWSWQLVMKILCSKMPQKASFDWKKLFWILEELKSKLKHWKAQNSILPRKFAWWPVRETRRFVSYQKCRRFSVHHPLIFNDVIFFCLDSFCLVYKKICLLICPFLLINI